MPIALDSVNYFDSGSTLAATHSHLAGTVAGDATMLVVAVLTGTSCAHNGVTYNGVAMTKAADTGLVGSYFRASIWTLANPTSGDQTVQVTLSANAYCQFYASSWRGTLTSTGATNTLAAVANSGTTASVGVTTTKVGSVVVDAALMNHKNVTAPGGSQTAIGTPTWRATDSWSGGSSYQAAPTITSYTMSWSSVDTDSALIAAVELLAAPGRGLLLMGIG